MNIEDNNILVNTYKYYCEKCNYGTDIKNAGYNFIKIWENDYKLQSIN